MRLSADSMGKVWFALLGAVLFGVAGAFLAVPIAAPILSLLNIYGHRYELLPDIQRVINESSNRPKERTPALVPDRQGIEMSRTTNDTS